MKAQGTLERLAEARAAGGEQYLKFLEQVDRQLVENMETEAGVGYDRWSRNETTRRLRHIRQAAGQPPEPVENDLFSVIEDARAPFNDNVASVEWEARRATATPRLFVYRRLWDWAVMEVGWRSWWHSMFDGLPECGISNTKVGMDLAAPGGRPVMWRADQKHVAYDRGTRLNHRTARIIRVTNVCELGELRDLHPGLADRIAAYDAAPAKSGREYELDRGRDRGDQGAAARAADDEGAIKETWFLLRPDRRAYLETMKNEPDAMAEAMAAEPWLVASWIPGAGVIKDAIVAGGRVFSSQRWRNHGHVVGLTDYDMVIGLALAAHRYQMRGHRRRLTSALPPFLLPRDSGIRKKEFNGSENLILQPDTADSTRGIGYVNDPGPSAEMQAWLEGLVPKMRRTLGTDKISSEILNRQLTATQVKAVQDAVETQARQTIAYFGDMVVDAATALMRLVIEHRSEPVEVPRADDDGFDVLTPDMWANLDPSEVVARSSTDRVGALTDAGKMASLQSLVESGLFTDDAGRPDLPIEMIEEYIDVANPPRAASLKAAARRRYAAQTLAAQEAATQAAAETAAAPTAAVPGATDGTATPGPEALQSPGGMDEAMADEDAMAAAAA